MLFYLIVLNRWTRGRVAYSSSLLRSRPRKGSVGSNPPVSAKRGTLSKRKRKCIPARMGVVHLRVITTRFRAVKWSEEKRIIEQLR